MYKSQQRIGSERVLKRNAEIKKLRDENEKLTSLVRKSEERINQLFDAKEKEKQERMRADRLADQLFGRNITALFFFAKLDNNFWTTSTILGKKWTPPKFVEKIKFSQSRHHKHLYEEAGQQLIFLRKNGSTKRGGTKI